LNLIIDIGNTRTKVGVFEENKLVRKLIWNEWNLTSLKAFLKKKDYQRVAISTVRNVDKPTDTFLDKNYFYLNLDANTALPIKNLYKTPGTLGKDRLAAVVGAFELFPGKASLVIDAGTCITYDIITQQGHYLGGNISPGIKMRFKAMNAFTAKLPLVRKRSRSNIVGNTTQSALQTGGQWGAILEMEGFIQRYSDRFGQINVILTGGDANFFAKNLKTQIFVNNNLVLIGLNKILNYNVQLLE